MRFGTEHGVLHFKYRHATGKPVDDVLPPDDLSSGRKLNLC